MESYKENLKCIYGSGNFVLLQLQKANFKSELITYLIDHKIYVRDVSQTEFLRKYCIRITIGTDEQMEYVGKVIGTFFEDGENGTNCVN